MGHAAATCYGCRITGMVDQIHRQSCPWPSPFPWVLVAAVPEQIMIPICSVVFKTSKYIEPSQDSNAFLMDRRLPDRLVQIASQLRVHVVTFCCRSGSFFLKKNQQIKIQECMHHKLAKMTCFIYICICASKHQVFFSKGIHQELFKVLLGTGEAGKPCIQLFGEPIFQGGRPKESARIKKPIQRCFPNLQIQFVCAG